MQPISSEKCPINIVSSSDHNLSMSIFPTEFGREIDDNCLKTLHKRPQVPDSL